MREQNKEKTFAVDVDITISKRIYIDAKNEKEAKEMVNNSILENPYYYAKSADAYVSHEITDINID